MEETGYTLADFSVALGGFEKANPKIPRFWGSGVLVQKGKRFGILTAHHCVHGDYDLQFGFGGDKLVLVLKRAQFVVLPPEILIKHALGIPNGIEMEPDLAFIEILPSPQLGHIKAVSSFEVLDKNPLNIAKDLVGIERPFVVVGFPGEYHQPPKKEGRTTRIIVKHMTYFYSIASDSIQERDGWDYIEANNEYEGNDDLPSSFAGVSAALFPRLQPHRKYVEQNQTTSPQPGPAHRLGTASGQCQRLRCHHRHRLPWLLFTRQIRYMIYINALIRASP